MITKLSYTDRTQALVPIIQVIVILTIFIFTPLNPLLYKVILKDKDNVSVKNSQENDLEDKLINHQKVSDKSSMPYLQIMEKQSTNRLNFQFSDEKEKQNAEEGYNEMKIRISNKKGCAKYFKLLDEFIIKPIFIFNYKYRAKRIEIEKTSKTRLTMNAEVDWKKRFTIRSNKTTNGLPDNIMIYKERQESVNHSPTKSPGKSILKKKTNIAAYGNSFLIKNNRFTRTK